MNQSEMEKFFETPEHLKKIRDLTSAEEVVKYLAENGIECNAERAEALKKFLDSPSDAEVLSTVPEEQLEEISGGKITAGKVAAGVAAGAVLIVGGKFLYDVYNDYNKHYSQVDNAQDFLGHFGANVNRYGKKFLDEKGITSDKRSLWQKGVEGTYEGLFRLKNGILEELDK